MQVAQKQLSLSPVASATKGAVVLQHSRAGAWSALKHKMPLEVRTLREQTGQPQLIVLPHLPEGDLRIANSPVSTRAWCCCRIQQIRTGHKSLLEPQNSSTSSCPYHPMVGESPSRHSAEDAADDERVSKTLTRMGACCAGGSVTNVKSIKPASRTRSGALESTRLRSARSLMESVARPSVADSPWGALTPRWYRQPRELGRPSNTRWACARCKIFQSASVSGDQGIVAVGSTEAMKRLPLQYCFLAYRRVVDHDHGELRTPCQSCQGHVVDRGVACGSDRLALRGADEQSGWELHRRCRARERAEPQAGAARAQETAARPRGARNKRREQDGEREPRRALDHCFTMR